MLTLLVWLVDLVVASLRSHPSQTCFCQEVCLCNMSVQEDLVDSRDPSDVNEVATAFPSEDDAIREWRR